MTTFYTYPKHTPDQARSKRIRSRRGGQRNKKTGGSGRRRRGIGRDRGRIRGATGGGAIEAGHAWSDHTEAHIWKFQIPGLSALASFRVPGAAFRLLSKFSDLATKRIGLRIALQRGQDFFYVSFGVSSVASLPSTPDTDAVGLKADISEGSADI